MSGSNALQIVDPNADNPLAQAPSWADAAQSVVGTVSGGVDALGQWLAAQRAKSSQMGLWNDQTGLPTGKGLVSAAQQTGNALLMGTTAPGIRAFHGSPYDFERFDTSKIGTGEGAQAYGHGLYFAEKEGTAQSYRDALTPTVHGFIAMDSVLSRFGGWRPAEADVKEALTGHDVLAPLADNPAVVDAVRRLAPDYSPSGAVTGDALRHYRTINDAIEAAAPKGKMYEVGINADPEQFLHWDRPISEQSPQVQQALQKAGIPVTQQFSYAGTRSFPTREGADAIAQSQKLGDYTIRQDADGYSIIVPRPGKGSDIVAGARDPAAASEMLQRAGIPGIRYLDQGSRGAGEGTHNYVVFDANTIDILRKYGLAGLGLGLGAAATNGSQQQPPMAQ